MGNIQGGSIKKRKNKKYTKKYGGEIVIRIKSDLDNLIEQFLEESEQIREDKIIINEEISSLDQLINNFL